VSKTYEPVLIRTAVVAAVTALVHACVLLGYLPFTPESEQAVANVIDLAGTAIAAIWARNAVVPVVKLEDAVASSQGVIEGTGEDEYEYEDAEPGV